MTGIAVGQIGLSLDTFLGLTLQQFDNAYERYMDRIEADDIQAERNARLTAFRIVCPPEGKTLSLYDFWPIKGDEELKRLAKAAKKKKQKPSTAARYEQLKNKWQ